MLTVMLYYSSGLNSFPLPQGSNFNYIIGVQNERTKYATDGSRSKIILKEKRIQQLVLESFLARKLRPFYE